MSVSLPSDVMIEIFCRLPQSAVATTCRSVCKEWNSITRELQLWQKVALLASIDIKLGATAQEIESYLKRCIVISSNEKLKEKFQSFFSNIPEGETRALHYLAASKTDAYGFFIKTKNAAISTQITGPECVDPIGLKDFIEKIQGLTIIGKHEADFAVNHINITSYAYPDERVETLNIDRKLQSDYFPISEYAFG